MEAANIHIDPRFSGRGPFKDTATVKIVVEDADEPPVFSSPTYLLEVHENAALNSVIGQVTARDPDITSSPIRYFSFKWSTCYFVGQEKEPLGLFFSDEGLSVSLSSCCVGGVDFHMFIY